MPPIRHFVFSTSGSGTTQLTQYTNLIWWNTHLSYGGQLSTFRGGRINLPAIPSNVSCRIVLSGGSCVCSQAHPRSIQCRTVLTPCKYFLGIHSYLADPPQKVRALHSQSAPIISSSGWTRKQTHSKHRSIQCPSMKLNFFVVYSNLLSFQYKRLITS